MTDKASMAKPTRPGGDAPAEPSRKRGPLGWVIGWVLVPGLVLGSIVAAGVHLGANHPGAWYTRAALWIAGLF